jgi:hypothetical protein
VPVFGRPTTRADVKHRSSPTTPLNHSTLTHPLPRLISSDINTSKGIKMTWSDTHVSVRPEVNPSKSSISSRRSILLKRSNPSIRDPIPTERIESSSRSLQPYIVFRIKGPKAGTIYKHCFHVGCTQLSTHFQTCFIQSPLAHSTPQP